MYRPLPPTLTINYSPINGLGLFATSHISAKTSLGISHIEDERFEHGWIRTPLGGFYNHSDNPNCRVVRTGNLRKLVTIRDINAGEELTARYTLYIP